MAFVVHSHQICVFHFSLSLLLDETIEKTGKSENQCLHLYLGMSLKIFLQMSLYNFGDK